MWETILAGMLFLMAPGKSVYSQVVVAPEAPRPCDDAYSLLCSPPHWSEAHGAFTVAESYEQGLARYATIARAAAEVVSDQRWSSPRGTLWKYLVTFIYAESGFRRDVHEGLGSAASGDCDWRTVKRGNNEVRERIPGSCRSHCLAQIQLGPMHSRARTRVEGYGPRDLVGTDLASTKRCLEVATRVIDGALFHCSRWARGPVAACVVNQYGGGLISMKDKRVRERIRWLNKLSGAPTVLSPAVRELLTLPPESADVDAPSTVAEPVSMR